MSSVCFTAWIQGDWRGNTVTFSCKISSDLLITAAISLHAETLLLSLVSIVHKRSHKAISSQPSELREEKEKSSPVIVKSMSHSVRLEMSMTVSLSEACVQVNTSPLCSLFNYEATKDRVFGVTRKIIHGQITWSWMKNNLQGKDKRRFSTWWTTTCQGGFRLDSR